MILTLFLLAWRLLWIPLLPVVLIYLWRRGAKDPLYRASLAERFGFYRRPLPMGAIWFHAVSLGETRSATALIRLCLDRGDKVVLTHFTPAGRRESARLFAAEIASGQLAAVWVPFDMRWCWRRFFRACRPVIGLTLEVEIWPAMIFGARAAGVPLYMCNAQYPAPSLARDSRGLRLRQRVIRGFAGAFVKSGLQARRFASVGLENITVTGELRFDQPVPPGQPEAAARLRPRLAGTREVIAIASGVEAEEALYLDTIRALCRPGGPLFVYVPRAPERFDAVAAGLEAAGLKVLRRSTALGPGPEGLADLRIAPAGDEDVLLGDSLGEMFFYLALADRVVVGGGFNPRGAHNVIEPLMMGKPVLTGSWTWTIEYPFTEAEAAGVARSLPDSAALAGALAQPADGTGDRIAAFLSEHAGGSRRTLAAIDRVIGRSG
ncbi:3-deoxy-D-manno-octulosonic acid transferase [Pseudogemmobacter humi]|uniref:3-deoxy-D-manno-octulosonic acid transferase n=1 Tax=Pseudogemmobacter humi TaxID=2483812 RepID=A0A3P5XKF1_9RHOB|nr:glycosyltransferase N-terminal domain-containing protein [Pseudogemmobacter humi]VDC29214.1 3-deoxy-D-manno-octulosonic acid transferase [Pseudogemmobacter humi]